MTVFKYGDISQIRTNLTDALANYISQLAPVLTEDEYLACFFLPEHVQALRDIIKLVGRIPTDSVLNTKLRTTDGADLPVGVFFGSGFPLPAPIYAGLGPVRTAPPELLARLTEFADARQRAGRAFGDAWDAVVWLNAVCDKASTMKIMFPALPACMAVRSDPDHPMSKKAAKLVGITSFGALPRLSQISRQRFQDASVFINAVSLTRGNETKEVPNNCAVVRSRVLTAGDGSMHPDDEWHTGTVL